MKKADMILRSSAIFTGLSKEPISGFVAVSGNKILAVWMYTASSPDIFSQLQDGISVIALLQSRYSMKLPNTPQSLEIM